MRNRAWLPFLLSVALASGLAAEPRQAPGEVQVRVAAGGQPVAGAHVRLGGRQAATGADGTCVFDGVPAGAYPLVADVPGYDYHRREVSLAAGRREPLTIDLRAVEPASWAGRVVLAGPATPLAGAIIRLSPVEVQAAMFGPATLVSSWDGTFQVTGLPPGKYQAKVLAAGCAAATMEATLAGETKAGDLALRATAETADLQVTVTDTVTGAPVPNAKVSLAEAWPLARLAEATANAAGVASFADLRLGVRNVADAQGAAALGRAAVAVRAEATGYAPNLATARLGPGAKATIALDPVAAVPEREPNNDVAGAQAIPLNAPVQVGYLVKDEPDWFKIRIAQPSLVQFAVGPTNPVVTTLKVLAADGAELRSSWNYAGQAVQYDLWLMPGDYAVLVQGNDKSTTTTTLQVTATPTGDAFEPNNDVASARVVRCGEVIRGWYAAQGDSDHFRFEVTRPGAVRLVLPTHPLTRNLRLLNAAGEQVAATWNYGGQAVQIDRYLAPGWYVAQTDAGNSAAVEPYELHLDYLPDTEDPAEDTAPPTAPALALEPGALVAAVAHPAGDVDRYAITVPCAGRLHVRLTAPYTQELRLFSATGQELRAGWNYGNQATDCHVDLDGPALVIAAARGAGDQASTVPYQLSARFEPCDELETLGRNDTADAAIPIELGDPQRGTPLPASDVDWYAVKVDHPGVLDATVTGAVTTELRIFTPTGEELASGWNYGSQAVNLTRFCLPGDYLLRTRASGEAISLQAYALKATLRRAEPQETVPLAEDPPRPLALGEGAAWCPDLPGDVDRFDLTVAEAGDYLVLINGPVTYDYRLTDALTGAEVALSWQYGGNVTRLAVKAGGPTRYQLRVRARGDGRSDEPGFVLFARDGAPWPAATVTAAADPHDPTQVTFRRAELKGYAAPERLRLDADGNGTPDLDLAAETATFRYPAEGLYPAVAVFEAGGSTVRRTFWVDATGVPERRGVRLLVDQPTDGQVIDRDRPLSARVTSYSGSRIAGVTAAIDGLELAPVYEAPYRIDVPWRRLGRGEHQLTVTARDAQGATAEVQRTFTISEFFDLQPTDGAMVTGTRVRVSWQAGAFGPAKVRYRKQGQGEWTEAPGANSAAPVIDLTDLEAGVPYEYQPVGATAGPIRTVTRVKGLAFSRARYGASLRRDYDQRVPVAVRNHGDQPATVRLECGRPDHPEMLVGFVGEGSEGAPVQLAPGEEREFVLGLSAQDVIDPVHRFAIRLAGDNGWTDEAEVELHVKLPEVKLEWAVLGDTPTGLGKRYRLTNRGDGLTDLDVTSDNPDITLSPFVRHALLPPGQSLDVTAWPRLYQGFTKAAGTLTAKAVGQTFTQAAELALPPGHSLFSVWLQPAGGSAEEVTQQQARCAAAALMNPAALDWAARREPTDTDGDGAPDRWKLADEDSDLVWIGDDTDGDGEVDFVHADYGDDGICEASACRVGQRWQPTNLVEAFLELGFSLPWGSSSYEKHDVDVVFNDQVIGKLRDTIPNGSYAFRIPPQILRFDPSGRPAGNVVAIQSKHLRGGHYVVTSDFRIRVRLVAGQQWVAATSAADAQEKAKQIEGVSIAGPDFTVAASGIQLAPAQPKAGEKVTIRATIRNLGATSPRELAVALRLVPASGDPVELGRQRVTNPPLAGDFTVELPWTATPGNLRLQVVVDPEQATAELERRNNVADFGVVVPGNDQPPTLKVLAPAEGANLPAGSFEVRAEATDDLGVAAVEASVDGGLWFRLRGDGPYAVKGFLQPGPHRVGVRVTDLSGHQVTTAVSVTATGEVPAARLVEPAAAQVAAPLVKVQVEVPAGTPLVGARVGGGPWRPLPVTGTAAGGDLPLRFGQQTIDVVVVDPKGFVKLLQATVTNTRQPLETDEVAGAPPPNSGWFNVPGLGTVDLFVAPSAIVPGT